MMGHLRAFLFCVLAGMLLCTWALFAQGPTIEFGTVAAPPSRIVDSIDESRLVTLKGNTYPLALAKYDRGRVDSGLRMGDLVLVLRRSAEQQAEFEVFVASQYDPHSANYHQWLEAAEVGTKFGPAQSDLDAITNWLSGHGFAIDEVSKDRLSIRFSGTAGQVESAFHTEIHNLQTSKKGVVEQHIANMSDPQIPSALTPVVVGVKALHNFFPKPLHRMGSRVTLDGQTGGWRRLPDEPASAKAPLTTRPRPQFGTADPYGDLVEDVAPYDFATIYNVLPLWQASSPIDGTGQTIAIAGTSNINLADVASFRSAFGLPAKVPSVVITNNDPGACPTFADSCAGDLVENTLDVEWSGAVAKGANIVLVTSSANSPTSDPLYLSESYIVQNKTAQIMNVSYGECELVLGNAGNTEYNTLWQTAASEGIAVFVASGDAGSPACDQGFDAIDGVPYLALFGDAVSGITSTPYNTSVGGTDFNWGSTTAPYWSASNNATTKASAVGYIPEVPWNSTCVNPLVLPDIESDAAYLGVTGVVDAESACNFILNNYTTIQSDFGVNLSGLVDTIGGGGGGSNCTFSSGSSGDPATCQNGYAKPSWQSKVTGIPSDNARDVPDVSFFASDGFLGSSYLICVSGGGSACTYSATAEPVAQEVGGTSVASPAMAGVMALINQKVGSSQGNPNTTLYTLAAEESYSGCSAETVKSTSSACIFNDIDTGTNAMACLNPEIEETFNCVVLYPQDAAGILFGWSAGVGYDLTTGLGSVNVANLANNWPTSATVAVANLSPSSLTFASTTVNAASATQTITLKNTGKVALTLNGTGQGITIAGTNASSFTQTNNCGTSVAAGASCSIVVVFKPTTTGTLTASVAVADNAYGSPQTVSLSGTGAAAAPIATLSAQSIGFGSTAVGGTNTAPAVTLTNTGSGPMTISSIGITGTNASSFAQTNTCGATLAAGANCAITISFKPTVAGSLTASLAVTDNAAGSPQTLALSGTATGGSGLTVTLSPASITFGSVTVGSTASAVSVTLANTGSAAVTLTSYTITGTNASSFVITQKTCPSSLPGGSSCNIPIEFAPTAAGSLTASLSVTDNATGSPQTVALSGTGASATGGTTLTLNVMSLSFASTAVGSQSAVQQIVVKNTGSATATFSGFTYTGANASSFVQTGINCGTTLAAGSACAIAVAFKPTVAGALTASLSIADNATGSPQTVALSGTGTGGTAAPAISLSPTTLTFASTTVGTASAAQTVTLKNTGTAALSITSVGLTGTNASSFLVSSNGCGSSVAAGASCAIAVAFKPTAAGSLTASLSIADNATGSPQTVALSGTGAAATGVTTLSLNVTNLTFASTAVGSQSAVQQIVVKNTGSATATFTGFTYTGANASSFVQTGINCGTTLAAGAACAIAVAFRPTVAGALTASLSIADNATGSPQTVALSGTGTGGTAAPAVSLSPTTLAFASTTVGTATAAQTVTLKNTGTAALSVTSVGLTGTNASSFVVSSNGCGSSVAAGASCAIAVEFKPAAAGSLTASLSVADSATGSPQTVALSGTGVTAGGGTLTVSPATIAFTSTAVGSQSAVQQVIVKNTGTTTVTFTGFTYTGANASSFVQTGINCGATLAAGSACAIAVAFKPTVAGALTASLSIADNAAGSPQTVALTGTGTSASGTPTLTLNVTSLTFASTAVGSQSAVQQIVVKNTGSVTAAFTGFTYTGADASSFVQTGINCGTTLATGSACAIAVAFKPAATGTLTAALSIADNATGSPQTVSLMGTGN